MKLFFSYTYMDNKIPCKLVAVDFIITNSLNNYVKEMCGCLTYVLSNSDSN